MLLGLMLFESTTMHYRRVLSTRLTMRVMNVRTYAGRQCEGSKINTQTRSTQLNSTADEAEHRTEKIQGPEALVKNFPGFAIMALRIWLAGDGPAGRYVHVSTEHVMVERHRIAVIGAYGQVGRKLVALLCEVLPQIPLLLLGRNRALLEEVAGEKHEIAVVDVRDLNSLSKALSNCGIAINCSGPFLALGIDVAEAALIAGTSLIDIASEQEHYRRFIALDARAKNARCSLLTGAGAYPGITAMLVLDLLQRMPGAKKARMASMSGVPESPEDGRASILAAILEMPGQLEVLRTGRLVSVQPGRSIMDVQFRPPFGQCKLLAWPQMEILALADKTGLQECETAVALGGDASTIPLFLIHLLRLLRPTKNRGFLYRLLSRAAARRAREDYESGKRNNFPGGAAIFSAVEGPDGRIEAQAYSTDMALATAYLPVAIVARYLSNGFRPGARFGGFELDWDDFVDFSRQQEWELNFTVDHG